jgi:hypothetical protein
MKEIILHIHDMVATGLIYIGLVGLLATILYCVIAAYFGSVRAFAVTKHSVMMIPMLILGIIVGGTKPPIIKAIIVWDDGLHDAGTKVDTNDLRNITFRWTYDDWIPNVATVDIKAYDIHTVNQDPTVDRGFYVCNGVPITDRTAMVLMETDATNYCYYVSQSYIPDAPVVTNGVYHIHAVGTNNVWVPIGLKIFKDSRIISPRGEIR